MTDVRLEQWRGAALDWYGGRSRREQALLAVAAALALIALFAVGVWRPMQDARVEARADIALAETVTARIRSGGPALAQRIAARNAASPTTLAASAAQFGLSIRRLEPDGARTHLVLEEVAFADLIRWLDQVERAGAFGIAEVKIERRPMPGVVNADLILAR